MQRIKLSREQGIKSKTIRIHYDPRQNNPIQKAMDRVRMEVSQAIDDGYSIIILSDRGTNQFNAAIPSLLATAGVHHHLIREGTRSKVGLAVETGEAREINHFALLIGYGAAAINPYLAIETVKTQISIQLFDCLRKFPLCFTDGNLSFHGQ